MANFYFSCFEERTPPPPLTPNPIIEFTWQLLSVVTLVFGANYIRWRWMESLNYDALWYAVPLVVAETLAFLGSILFTINLWQVKDVAKQSAPDCITQCVEPEQNIEPRAIKVDLFIATYSEDTELVRLSIQDAKRIT